MPMAKTVLSFANELLVMKHVMPHICARTLCRAIKMTWTLLTNKTNTMLALAMNMQAMRHCIHLFTLITWEFCAFPMQFSMYSQGLFCRIKLIYYTICIWNLENDTLHGLASENDSLCDKNTFYIEAVLWSEHLWCDNPSLLHCWTCPHIGCTSMASPQDGNALYEQSVPF